VKSLAILPNWVGDTVMALPVLDALASSGRRLSVLGRPHLRPLLEGRSGIAEYVVRAASNAGTIDALSDSGFDEAVILPNSYRAAWLAHRAGIPKRWGYGGWSPEGLLRGALLAPRVPDHRERGRHQVADYTELLSAMELEVPTEWIPRLELTPQQVREGRDLLARSHLDPSRSPLIGLFAGAEFGPSKRWPWKRFAELAQQLRRNLPGSQQLVLAGPKETWLAVRIHEESGKIHPVVGPDLDLGQLASVMSEMDLLVTNDSGPMHLAAALGIPCLSIFGPTDPRRTSPVGDAHRVLYTDRWCSPCFRRRCPLLRHRCMRDITVGEVTQQAIQMLAPE
jgi:heptosyltransferase-2